LTDLGRGKSKSISKTIFSQFVGWFGGSYGMATESINLEILFLPLYVGPFEFPAHLTGDTCANFLNMQLPHLLDDF
jgi:hypothetical protein